MLRKKILRSVTAPVNFTLQCRNFSSGSRRNLSSRSSNSDLVSKAVRLTGWTLGLGSGYLLVGGRVAKCEERRQKIGRDKLGHDVIIEDIRVKMWPELRRFMLFRKMRKEWSTSAIRKDLESIRCSFWENLSSVGDGWEEESNLRKEEIIPNMENPWTNAVALENKFRASPEKPTLSFVSERRRERPASLKDIEELSKD